jgi:hypothetical protein
LYNFTDLVGLELKELKIDVETPPGKVLQLKPKKKLSKRKSQKVSTNAESNDAAN